MKLLPRRCSECGFDPCACGDENYEEADVWEAAARKKYALHVVNHSTAKLLCEYCDLETELGIRDQKGRL